jgi:hypothetical protein
MCNPPTGSDCQPTNLILCLQCYLMSQDPMLFGISIRENIAYGRAYAAPQDVEDAAKVAAIHDFIQTLPNGYDEVVGERGVTLSGTTNRSMENRLIRGVQWMTSGSGQREARPTLPCIARLYEGCLGWTEHQNLCVLWVRQGGSGSVSPLPGRCCESHVCSSLMRQPGGFRSGRWRCHAP